MRRLQALISTVLPDLFKMPRTTTDPNSPLIYSGSLLHVSDIQMLPVQRNELARKGKSGIRLYGAFGSYAVLQSILILPPENAYQFLWTPTRDSLVWIGSVSSDSPFDRLLSVFEATGFGAARVSKRQIHTLITLEDVVNLIRMGVLTSEVRISSISSEPITTSRDTTLADALQLMFEGKVRRLFLDDEPRKYISDRSILALLFSPYMLKVARDSPGKWLDLRVNQIPKREATSVPSEASLLDAASLLTQGSDECLVTSKNRVVTRWDIVIKSWKKDLEFVAEQPISPEVRNKFSHRARIRDASKE
ncbi:MAG: CBS domain-containing protein [Thaumarchaeota archaeon]|nr:CBS domain-containing protein [Nitrososphaerota archaeon]